MVIRMLRYFFVLSRFVNVNFSIYKDIISDQKHFFYLLPAEICIFTSVESAFLITCSIEVFKNQQSIIYKSVFF